MSRHDALLVKQIDLSNVFSRSLKECADVAYQRCQVRLGPRNQGTAPVYP